MTAASLRRATGESYQTANRLLKVLAELQVIVTEHRDHLALVNRIHDSGARQLPEDPPHDPPYDPRD